MKKILLLIAACFSLSFTGPLFAGESGSIEFLNSGKVLPTTLPFSEAVRVGNMLYLADISEWGAFNEVYKTFFSKPYPARSALGANGLALGARVEVEFTAAVDK